MKCQYDGCTEAFKGSLGQCIKLYDLHVGAMHAVAKATAPGASEASGSGAIRKEEKRKTERAKIKPPTFRENEARDDYERKKQDFEIYSKWATLTKEERSEDLYLACETPLKTRVRASGILEDQLGETDFAALSTEIERISAPKGNRYVERNEFHCLTQGEDELITAFESRLRLKAKQCDFCNCRDNCKERCMTKLKCGFDKNQDEVIQQLLAGMRDKDLQKQLWADDQHMQDLPALLTKIKSHEAADSRQAASNGESGSFIIKMKCHKCGKTGHTQRNCKSGEGKTMSSKCGFCGGPSKCKMKKCKAYNIKCNTCSLFGHYSSCCTDFTKTRARKVRDVTAASAVEDSGEESNHIVRLSNISQEKISSGTQEEVSNVELSNVSQEKISNKSQGKGGDNKVTTNRSRGDDAKIEATNTHVIRINR